MSSKVLVVGSGVLGLRTALELLRKNIPIILRSSHPPIHKSTCSMGAGGLWMPYKCDDPRIDKWSIETLNELLPLCNNNKSDKHQISSPVEIVPTIYLTTSYRGPPRIDDDYFSKKNVNTNNHLPEWTKDTRISFQHLTIEMLLWQNSVFKLRIPSEKDLLDSGYTHAWFFYPPIVDPPKMLMNMMDEIQSHPLIEKTTGSIDMNTCYNTLDEIIQDAKKLGCDAIANCTGLGAAQLCNDPILVGGRGTLLHFDRSCVRKKHINEQQLEFDACILTEEGDWGSAVEPCYLIPRGDILVVGGSYKEGNLGETITKEERKRLIKNAARLGIDTEKVEPINEWVGWRPCRKSVRVEIENKDSIRVVHCYGVGGSGWTVFSGVAKEAVSKLLQQT